MPYIGNQHNVGDHVNNFKVLDDISSHTATFDGSAASVIDTTNNTIRVPLHRFIQGQRVTYTNGGGGNIGGLTSGTAYFVSFDSANTIKLATTLANANSNTVINISAVGSGTSHTLNVAFDGVNTKFKMTHSSGKAARLNNATQLSVAINNVIQRPNQSALSFTEGFALEDNHKIVFKTAPTVNDVFWGSIIANTIENFDLRDNEVDNFTGDGSTTEFTLSTIPANNESVIVSINGVVQHPSDKNTARSYTLIDSILEFTAAPALGDEIQVRHIGFAGASTNDVSGFYGRTGNVALISSDHITTGDITSRNINSSGIITATTFDGAFSSSVGGSNANFTGIVTAGVFKGGDIEGRNLKITGLSTFVGDASFTGNVSIGGTLTYEDVTNVDAVGIVTAREGVHIPDNKRLDFGGTAGDGDFEIRHTSGNTFIENNTGAFFISQSGNATSNPLTIHGGSELRLKHYYSNGGQLDAIKSVRGYQTEIYWQGQKKIETTAKGVLVGTGVTIETSGQANFAGITTFSNTVHIGTGTTIESNGQATFVGITTFHDGVRLPNFYPGSIVGKIQIGDSNGYEIFHYNNNNYLTFTRPLLIRGDNIGRQIKLQPKIAQQGIIVNPDGAVELYHSGGTSSVNGTKIFETASSGINVIGVTTTTGLAVSGVSTFTGAIDANGDIDVDGHTNLDNVSVAGVSTFTGISDHSSRIQMLAGNAVRFLNNANSASTEIFCNGGAKLNITSYNQTMATFENGQPTIFYTDSGQNRLQINNNGNVSIFKDLDVDGHTNLDNTSIAGIVTAQNIRYQSGGNNWNGHPRSVVIGYSGSNYANLGMGWVPTSTNGQYTSANSDYQSRLQLYDGLQIYGSGASVTSGQTVTWNTVADFKPGAIKLYTSGSSNSEKLRITSNGKVNIGTGELDQTDRMLNIYGGRARISGITAGNSFEIYASNTSGQSYGILCQAGTNSSDINTALRNTSGVSLFRVRGDGVVFVGSSTVQQGSTSKLEVMGTLNNSYPNYSYPIMVSDDAAYNSSGGPGGGIGFSFKQNSGGAYAQAGGIRGVKENTTDGDYASALLFYTRANGAGTTEQVRITSRGHLNLGGGLGGDNTRNFTTLFDMHPVCNPAGALFNYNNNNIYLSQNVYFTGQWQLDQADAGSYFHQSAGGFNFLSAPSGSAGAATSLYKLVGFEPRNLSTGLNRSANRPSVKGNLVVFGESSASTAGGIEFHTSSGGGGGYGSRITAAGDGSLAFHVRNNNSAWMTPLQYVWNGDLSWGENPNNTLYDEGSNHGAYYRRQQGSFQFATKSSSGWSNVYLNKNTSGGTSDYRWIDFYWNSTSRGQITWNGSNVVYGGASDYRLKENVVDITDGISRVKQLQPRRFNWINDPTKNTQDGFIAHEVQSVIPIAVTGTKDKVVTQEEFNNDTQPEDKEVGTPIYQQMDYGKVTPLLTAAVKELIAKVETLEAEVAALKGS